MKMDEQERAEYEAEGKKERERHVKNLGLQLVGSSAVWSIFLRNGGEGSTRMTILLCMQ